MQRKIVWIGGIVLVLVFLSGFIFCPHMRLFPSSGSEYSSASENRSAVIPVAHEDTGQQKEVESQDRPIETKRSAPIGLTVMTDEQLKATNYRSYVYRSYAKNILPQGAALPSQEESKRWVQEQFAPKLLERLAENKKS